MAWHVFRFNMRGRFPIRLPCAVIFILVGVVTLLVNHDELWAAKELNIASLQIVRIGLQPTSLRTGAEIAVLSGRLLQIGGAEVQTSYLSGELSLLAGDQATAARWFAQVPATASRHSMALFRIVRLAEQAQDWETVTQSYLRIPGPSHSRWRLAWRETLAQGQELFTQGQPAEAFKLYLAARLLAPGRLGHTTQAEYLMVLEHCLAGSPITSYNRFLLAYVLSRQGKLDPASDQIEALMQLPGWQDFLRPDEIAEVYDILANSALQRGSLSEAIRWYQSALDADPQSLLTRLRLIPVLEQAGRTEEASRHLYDLEALEPSFIVRSPLSSGRLLVGLERDETAVALGISGAVLLVYEASDRGPEGIALCEGVNNGKACRRVGRRVFAVGEMENLAPWGLENVDLGWPFTQYGDETVMDGRHQLVHTMRAGREVPTLRLVTAGQPRSWSSVSAPVGGADVCILSGWQQCSERTCDTAAGFAWSKEYYPDPDLNMMSYDLHYSTSGSSSWSRFAVLSKVPTEANWVRAWLYNLTSDTQMNYNNVALFCLPRIASR